MAQMVKNLPAIQETWVQSLGQEDPLEKGIATHSSILAWEIPWTEEPGKLESMGSPKESDTTEHLNNYNNFKMEMIWTSVDGRGGEGSPGGGNSLWWTQRLAPAAWG